MTADIGSGPPPAPPSRWASWRHELGEEGARGALVAFVATLAEAEGLVAHADSVRLRNERPR